VKAANKALDKRIEEGEYKTHEGFTIKEIPWNEYESTTTGRLDREIKKWKRQMEEHKISSQEFSDVTEVVRGDDEVAFWLRDSGKHNYNEIFIAVQLRHKICPFSQRCKFEIWDGSSNVERQQPFKSLFEHFLNHYDPEVQGHSTFENMAYAILQQFVIIESNRGRGSHHNNDKIAVAIHEIIKTFGIPTQLVANILSITYTRTANAYYHGIYLCKDGIPAWMQRVLGETPYGAPPPRET
jgi:hypothetical protein